MSISGSVLAALGSGLAKWLAKRYLGDLNAELVGGLIDFGREKIPDLIERRSAARHFERYADEILKKLLESLAARRKQHPALDDDAVCRELIETINGRITEHFLLAKDLDPRIIAADLRQQRPLPVERLPELETRVYEQVLDETVRYIIEVASLLPRFDAIVASESLTRLSNLGQDVTDVLNTVRRLEVRVTESTVEGQEARWEADYRAAVIRHLDRVELFGADIPPEAQRNLLTEAFVSLNVERPDRDAHVARSDGEGGEQVRRVTSGLLTCQELFDGLDADSRRVIIRGSAGSGKTTLLRWAAIQAANAAVRKVALGRIVRGPDGRKTIHSPILDIEAGVFVEEMLEPEAQRRAVDDPSLAIFRYSPETPDWQLRIPFFIPLRHCQSGKLPAPDDLPTMIAKEVGRPPTDWVRKTLNEGRALVMLDGVDEVPAQNRGMLKDEIKAIVDAYPNCYFVLTSRPTAIEEDWLKDRGFQNADVSPMTMPDVERFVQRWHEAVGKELGRQGRPDPNLAVDAERLMQQFHQNPPLSLLATNPLLCAMICALHRMRQQKLPESQYELCETLCHMLLHKRERESHFNWQEFPAPYIALSYEQKRGIAQQLAQWLVHNGQSAMPLKMADEQVARALERIPGRISDEAPVILKTLVERSGLLREPNPDVVDFLHNTFKELLAGDDLAGRGDADAVMRHLGDESWRRVALFAVASPRSQTFASLLVGRLLHSIGEPEGVSSRTSGKRGEVRGLTDSGSPEEKSLASDVRKLKTRCSKDKSLLRTVLFVLQCRRVAQFLDGPLKEQADRLHEVPFPPADFEAAEAIAQLGDEAVPPLIAPKKLTPPQTAATVRALRMINTSASREALSRFLTSEDWNVISELAPAVDPLTIPAVVTAIQFFGNLSESIRKLIRDVSPLAGLTSLRVLDLRESGVTDLSPLAGLTSLKWLWLGGTGVTDVSPLAGLKSLQTLGLSTTGVTDVSPLAGLTRLQSLSLSDTGVTDVSSLAGLKSLQTLFLDGTGVTDVSPLAGLKQLQIAGVDSQRS